MRDKAGKTGRWWCGVLAGSLLCLGAQAARVVSVTPAGEVDQVPQVRLRFDTAVVPFGSPKLPDPATLRCEGLGAAAVAPPGTSRWTSDKEWAFDPTDSLPPGTSCTLSMAAGWKPLTGTLDGAREFRFSTGGPAILSAEPYEGGTIEEDQHWLLRLNGPVVPESVTRNAWCEVQGIGERVPVTWVDGAARKAVLKSQQVSDKDAARAVVLTCQRPLPPGAGVKLVWGAGIAAANNPKVVTRQVRRLGWDVRERFTAEFSCERERAEAPCIPVRPMTLKFSAPVPRALAAAVQLRAADGKGEPVTPKFGKNDTEPSVSEVSFPVPLAENTRYTLTLPKDFRDESGRALSNASAFPISTATGGMPPLAKFAAAPFGIVEAGTAADPGMLPITVRHVHEDGGPPPKARLNIKALGAAASDRELLQWFAKVEKHHETTFTAKEAGLPEKEWMVTEKVTRNGVEKLERRERFVGSREISLLARETDVQRSDLPGPGPETAKLAGATEVLGLPLKTSGYHVVEISSRVLGRALLDKNAPMYVRTGVLVTPMGVHFKQGRTSSLVWVTTLDRAQPVAEADVAVNDCKGQPLWSGRTDAQGLARIPRGFNDTVQSGCLVSNGLFVTARSPARADGTRDLSFVFSGWNKGIEPWRFNLPTASSELTDESTTRAHTVFDRTLLRVGETVSMKHWLRHETDRGLARFKAEEEPTEVEITHQGSGESVTLPYQRAMAWVIPKTAKLGVYEVTLKGRNLALSSGQFRVEAFKTPLVDARLQGPASPVVAPAEVNLSVQLSHFSGGGLATAASVNALLRPAGVDFPDYADYSFAPLSRRDPDTGEPVERLREQTLADRQAVKTDAQGAATTSIKLPEKVRALHVPAELVTELSFDDPNGERQTVGRTMVLWPSSLAVGIRARSWLAQGGRVPVQMVVLDTAGKPQAGQAIELRGEVHSLLTTRQKVVGGFYAYESRPQVKDLGKLCSGKTDARGLLVCDLDLDQSGEVQLVAQARDGSGRVAESATSVWVSQGGEVWFDQDNDDRIDLLPEKRDLKPGETARLQVRMPFREATALVTVEREGVVDARIVTLRGSDPVIEVPVPRASAAGTWAPNVYVSALVLRGRVRHVPWYSFFDWGWRSPSLWWNAWRHEGPDYRAPTAMVDLARPAFKLGVAALRVGLEDHRLEVKVTSDKPQYGVRQTARTTVQVLRGGEPLAGGEVAFAAVDEGLLALMPNTSWDLLEAMFQPRSWGVETATAQNEIIGRRHYGRKAVAAGGSGGRNPTRELFDTLLLWKPTVKLDAKGMATIDVPLNDSLTSFRLVAVAEGGIDQFGTGSASIRVSQDLQMLAGLPLLVREGDRFDALYTVRNTTSRAMMVKASLSGQPDQKVEIAAGAATEVRWNVTVPAGVATLSWEGAVEETGGSSGGAKDRIKVTQQVQPAVPVRVQQATIRQLDGPGVSWPVAPPADALPGQGGVQVTLKPKLAGALPGIRRYFELYPYRCLEQKTSRAIGLHDTAAWTALVGEMPSYLDSDGLAHYFPPLPDSSGGGSDALTAYILSASQVAGWKLPDAVRERMLAGLTAFVEGRLERRLPSPRNDGLERDVRKLAALEALSRHGRAQARLLGSLDISPQLWPTGVLLDWLAILRRVDGIPQQAQRLEEARNLLRARLVAGGTTLRFADEAGDGWWWLMAGADSNAARLLLAAVEDGPGWRDDLPRLVTGLMSRLDAQRSGAFGTTTANVWTTLALDRFSAAHESVPVTGRTTASLGGATRDQDWAVKPEGASLSLPWPAGATTASPATLKVDQQGTGKPWVALQSLAAVPLKAPIAAGYRIERTITPVEQAKSGQYTRGDVLRVQLKITAQADLGWVVVSDPVPGGATLLGGGLGRDSQIATRGEQDSGTAWRVYEERLPEAWRAYYAWLPRGTHTMEYTMRLNTTGRFALPPSRVEAMYAPENFGEVPVPAMDIVGQ